MINWQVWIDSLTKPAETFAKQRKKADLMEASKHWLLGYLIVGLITGIILGGLSNVAVGFITLVSFTLGGFIAAAIGEAIVYAFAKGLGGKSDFKTQFYLVGIFTAPLLVLGALVGLIPVAGVAIKILIGLYGLFVLTLALREAHKFDFGRAFLAWVLPIIVGIAIAVVMAALLIATFTAVIAGALAGIIGGGAAGGALGAVTGSGAVNLSSLFGGLAK